MVVVTSKNEGSSFFMYNLHNVCYTNTIKLMFIL